MLASAWKNSINVTIGGVEMFFSHHTLKSQNSIERIQLRMMCTTFNGNLFTTIIFCYSPTIPAMKKTLPPSITSYLPLSNTFLNKVLIISRDMNVHIDKDGTNKFCLHNSLNKRRGEYLAEFSLSNKLVCLNTKFQKCKEKL